MTYSLANYIIDIKLPSEFAAVVGLSESQNLTVGGEGSYLDSMSAEYNNDMVSTKGDATGSWVHDINLNRTGKITISLHQLSEKSAMFRKIVNLYYQSEEKEGFEIHLHDNSANEFVSGQDCYFVKIPTIEFNAESGNQSWEITVGKLIIN